MKYTYFHLMTKLCSLWHPCSIGKKLIQNLCYGLGIIHLAPVCRDWRRPSTWSRQGEGHRRSYKLVCIVELATYLFTYWPTLCKMWNGISEARVISCTLLLRANECYPRWRCQCRFWFTLATSTTARGLGWNQHPRQYHGKNSQNPFRLF
jgi:hypothetical protein